MIHSLSYCIMLLQRDFTRFCNQRLQELGLSQGLFYFLLYVGKHPSCSPKELTEALHLDAGYATRTIAKLEQTGFLLQSSNPKDRRGHILTLTDRGQEAFLEGYRLFSQWDDLAAKGLSPENKVLLTDFLTEVLQNRKENSYV